MATKQPKKRVGILTTRKINSYKNYFESEMSELSSRLDEFKANKEEFYRRWSQYSDFKKVESLLD